MVQNVDNSASGIHAIIVERHKECYIGMAQMPECKFIDIGAGFEAAHTVNVVPIGGTELKLMKQRELVDFAVEWIEKNRK